MGQFKEKKNEVRSVAIYLVGKVCCYNKRAHLRTEKCHWSSIGEEWGVELKFKNRLPWTSNWKMLLLGSLLGIAL